MTDAHGTEPQRIEELLDQIHSERAQDRQEGVYALARVTERRAVDVWRLADDPDLDVRLAVVETAEVLAIDPGPLLTYMSTDPSAEVCAHARRRLFGLGHHSE